MHYTVNLCCHPLESLEIMDVAKRCQTFFMTVKITITIICIQEHFPFSDTAVPSRDH